MTATMHDQVSILVADDHPIYRSGLKIPLNDIGVTPASGADGRGTSYYTGRTQELRPAPDA